MTYASAPSHAYELLELGRSSSSLSAAVHVPVVAALTAVTAPVQLPSAS